MHTTESGVQLHSRAGNDLAGRYPELADLDLPPNLVLDGEVVALDESGRPSFQRLQSRRGVGGGGGIVPVTYVVFDLLHHGESFIGAPLEDRVGQLGTLDLPAPLVVGDRFHGNSRPVWDFVVANDLEGIVAKRLGSRYQPGKRSPDWRKIGQFKHVRAVVGGFTAGTGARESTFGALLLGLQDGDKLRWIGAVGSGFNDNSLLAIRGALDEMTAGPSPFHPNLEIPAGATWVQPRLVAMVRYKQWTAAGRLRAPSFQGMTDTPVKSVSWEAEGPPAA